MKNVLVTGGAGYIGSQIVSDLIKLKYKVFIVDNLSTGYETLINKKAIFYKCNIGNKKKIQNFLKKNKIKSIIHCAASLNINESEKNPKKYYLNNVVNTKKLLEISAKNKIESFIFSSTAAVYGITKGQVSEKTITKPVSVYGKTKLQCEILVKKFSKKYKFKYGILRYFNVAGSDMRNKIGCINKNNQLFKNLALSLVNKKNKIKIFGNNYSTKDGTCIRDFIYVKDLSLIHCKLLNYIENNSKSLLLNCGYGYGYSVLDIVKNFEKILNIKIKKIFLPRRRGDVVEIFSNTSLLTRYLKIKFKKNKLKKFS